MRGADCRRAHCRYERHQAPTERSLDPSGDVPRLSAAVPGEVVTFLTHPGHHLAGPPKTVGGDLPIGTAPANVGERTPEIDATGTVLSHAVTQNAVENGLKRLVMPVGSA